MTSAAVAGPFKDGQAVAPPVAIPHELRVYRTGDPMGPDPAILEDQAAEAAREAQGGVREARRLAPGEAPATALAAPPDVVRYDVMSPGRKSRIPLRVLMAIAQMPAAFPPSMQQGWINPQWGVPVVQTGIPNLALGGDLVPSLAIDLPPAPLAALPDPFELRSRDQFYLGASGALYKYDLSNPIDQIRYSGDLLAQLKDSINLDPRVEIDSGIGEYGGGLSP